MVREGETNHETKQHTLKREKAVLVDWSNIVVAVIWTICWSWYMCVK